MRPTSSRRKALLVWRVASAAVVVLFCMASWALGPSDAAVPKQGWLGLTVQALTPDIATGLGLPRTQGALVNDVDANGPAATAGLKPGDVILAIDGRPISNQDDLLDQISCGAPGTRIRIDVLRDGQRETFSPQLTEMPEAAVSPRVTASSPTARWGLVVEPLTSVMAEVLAMPSASKGVVVTAVDPRGAGAASGLETIDVIEQVNGRPVGSPGELRFALLHASGKPALLFIDRNGLTMFLTMRVDQR